MKDGGEEDTLEGSKECIHRSVEQAGLLMRRKGEVVYCTVPVQRGRPRTERNEFRVGWQRAHCCC